MKTESRLRKDQIKKDVQVILISHTLKAFLGRFSPGVRRFLTQRAVKVAYVKMYFLESHAIFFTVILLAVIHVSYDVVQHDF